LKQLIELQEIYQTHRLPSHRRRAHAIILSNHGYSAAEVAEILGADEDTVRGWIDRFEANGCAGLIDQPYLIAAVLSPLGASLETLSQAFETPT
jgi:DNA-binding MarR family transcriptional regulator